MAVVGSKYTLESVMEEIQTIKSTQQRYAEQYLQPQTAGSASLSFVAGDGNTANDTQGQQLKNMEEAINRLEKIVKEVARATRENEMRIDDLEQYGRRNCLILHGCKNIPMQGSYVDFEKYVTGKLNARLTLDYKIKSHDIDTCHVLPSRKKGVIPIIIKFVRRSVWDLVYNNKRRLKSDGSLEKLSITESLTKRRPQLVVEARKAFGFFNVWTTNGNVYCIQDNKRLVIEDFGDIDTIVNDEI